MTVVQADLKREHRRFTVAFGVLAAGVAASLALASYAVTTGDSDDHTSAAGIHIATLGPSASLPGASAAQLNQYGRALTAHHAPAINWALLLGPSASLPGASVAQLNRYGRALTAHR
jgi:hypothetical protein